MVGVSRAPTACAAAFSTPGWTCPGLRFSSWPGTRVALPQRRQVTRVPIAFHSADAVSPQEVQANEIMCSLSEFNPWPRTSALTMPHDLGSRDELTAHC